MLYVDCFGEPLRALEPRHYSWRKPRLFLSDLCQPFASQNRKVKKWTKQSPSLCEQSAQPFDKSKFEIQV